MDCSPLEPVLSIEHDDIDHEPSSNPLLQAVNSTLMKLKTATHLELLYLYKHQLSDAPPKPCHDQLFS